MRNIILTGMYGSGKTVCGRELAALVGMDFIDTDTVIETSARRTVKEIFEGGEAVFRSLEKKVCEQLVSAENSVISLGSGAVADKSITDALKQNAVVIFIDRPLADILNGIDSDKIPFPSGKADVIRQRAELYDIYRSIADAIVINDGSIAECVQKMKECAESLGKELPQQ